MRDCMVHVTGEMVDVAQEHKGLERFNPPEYNTLCPL
jgi:hypothetical protein